MIILIFLNVISITGNFDFSDDEIFAQQVKEMTHWIKTNTEENEHFMFRYPRVVGLLTNRRGAQFFFNARHRERLPSRIQKYNIRYLINTKDRIEFQVQEFESDKFLLRQVWENDRYRVFEVLYKNIGS